MRPLKRPMFRTGGPIKEGVMNGLREGGVATTMADATMMAGGGRVPFANGGVYVKNPDGTLRPSKGVFSSDFNKGVYNADGTPITIPKRDFYEDASFVLNPLTKLKLASMLTKGGIRGGKEAISGGLGSLKNFFKGPVPARKAGEVKNRLVTTEKAPFLSDKFFGQYIKGPLQSTKKAFTDAFGPAAGSIKDYKTAVGLGIPITGFTGYKMYQGYKDRQKGSKTPPPPKAEVPEIKGTKEERDTYAKKFKEDQNKIKLDRIYNLLGVKRAQANAASKALIDMSRYIDEGGKDVISKKNIGSTISKAIGAFDKRLDKADQLKEAAGLMMAKGEIEKDIYGAKPGTQLKAAQDYQAQFGGTLKDAYKALGIGKKDMAVQISESLIKGARKSTDLIEAAYQAEGNPPAVLTVKSKDFTDWQDSKGDDESQTELDYVKEITDRKPGAYIIGTRVVIVDKELNPSFYY